MIFVIVLSVTGCVFSGYVSPPESGSKFPMAGGFVVRHYAGAVHYSPQALLKKNKDLVPSEVLLLLGQSEDPFVAEIIEALEGLNPEASPLVPALNTPVSGPSSPSSGDANSNPQLMQNFELKFFVCRHVSM